MTYGDVHTAGSMRYLVGLHLGLLLFRLLRRHEVHFFAV